MQQPNGLPNRNREPYTGNLDALDTTGVHIVKSITMDLPATKLVLSAGGFVIPIAQPTTPSRRKNEL
jgi:hypothetical protein